MRLFNWLYDGFKREIVGVFTRLSIIMFSAHHCTFSHPFMLTRFSIVLYYTGLNVRYILKVLMAGAQSGKYIIIQHN